jgi:hypothetical protein
VDPIETLVQEYRRVSECDEDYFSFHQSATRTLRVRGSHSLPDVVNLIETFRRYNDCEVGSVQYANAVCRTLEQINNLSAPIQEAVELISFVAKRTHGDRYVEDLAKKVCLLLEDRRNSVYQVP